MRVFVVNARRMRRSESFSRHIKGTWIGYQDVPTFTIPADICGIHAGDVAFAERIAREIIGANPEDEITVVEENI